MDASVVLQYREIDERHIRCAKIEVLGIFGDADNLVTLLVELEALPDRKPVAEVAARHRLIDDDDFPRLGVVRERELAPLDQRDARRLEITGADPIGIGPFLLPRWRIPIELE